MALRARLWIDACLAACRREGVPATVLARGDADAGSILLRWRRPDGLGAVLASFTDMEGVRRWHLATGPEPVAEAECAAYWQRQRNRDPDLWVLEVESPELWHPLGEPIGDPPQSAAKQEAEALFKRRR